MQKKPQMRLFFGSEEVFRKGIYLKWRSIATLYTTKEILRWKCNIDPTKQKSSKRWIRISWYWRNTQIYTMWSVTFLWIIEIGKFLLVSRKLSRNSNCFPYIQTMIGIYKYSILCPEINRWHFFVHHTVSPAKRQYSALAYTKKSVHQWRQFFVQFFILPSRNSMEDLRPHIHAE
jgi:hypothetical protein